MAEQAADGADLRVTLDFTSILWTLAHVGAIEPWWVKLAQIFPIGLALGWIYWRYGAESSVLAHGLFNLVALLVTPTLIT